MAHALPRRTPTRSRTRSRSPSAARGSSSSSASRCCRRFQVPEGYDADALLPARRARGARAALRGVRAAGGKTSTRRRTARASRSELDVIVGMKFPGYFLIVWDFIRDAKENGIPVGPGRGSGAGSIVAYALRITDLDPHPVQPALRALPEPGAREHAGLRRRLLHGPARRGHRVRRREVRQDERRADRDVPRAQGAERHQGRRRARWASRRPRRRTSRASIPQKGPGQTYTIPEALEVEPKLKALVDSDPTVARAARRRRRSSRGSRGTPACTPPAS